MSSATAAPSSSMRPSAAVDPSSNFSQQLNWWLTGPWNVSRYVEEDSFIFEVCFSSDGIVFDETGGRGQGAWPKSTKRHGTFIYAAAADNRRLMPRHFENFNHLLLVRRNPSVWSCLHQVLVENSGCIRTNGKESQRVRAFNWNESFTNPAKYFHIIKFWKNMN